MTKSISDNFLKNRCAILSDYTCVHKVVSIERVLSIDFLAIPIIEPSS